MASNAVRRQCSKVPTLPSRRRSSISWSTYGVVPRTFHTTTVSRAAHDTSTIDYVSMPRFEVDPEAHPEITRIPLLPTNSISAGRNNTHNEVIEPVFRTQITTVSADSTHIQSPSAMKEVTDNHAAELDPYTLSSKVAAAAAKLAHVPVEKATEEVGAMKEFWGGFLDDLLGAKKTAKG